MTEAAIQSEIHRVIGSRPDCRIWRQNTGVARDTRTGRMIRFGIPGTPDLIGIVSVGGIGAFLGIEVKSAKGKQTKAQKSFQSMLARMGGCYILARSVEDAERGLNAYVQKVSAQDSLHTAPREPAALPGRPSAPPRAE